MRNLVVILIVVLFSACSENEACINQTVKNDVWNQTGGTFPTGSIRFDNDDSITFVVNGSRRKYEFNKDCNQVSFNPSIGSTNPWNFSEVTENDISLTSDSNSLTFHRQ
jgi:hypothetical protein